MCRTRGDEEREPTTEIEVKELLVLATLCFLPFRVGRSLIGGSRRATRQGKGPGVYYSTPPPGHCWRWQEVLLWRTVQAPKRPKDLLGGRGVPVALLKRRAGRTTGNGTKREESHILEQIHDTPVIDMSPLAVVLLSRISMFVARDKQANSPCFDEAPSKGWVLSGPKHEYWLCCMSFCKVLSSTYR